jgi:hypothetical protein
MSAQPYRRAWHDEFEDTTARDELVRNHRVCASCYRPIRDKVTFPKTRGGVYNVPDELSPWRSDTTDDDPAGRFCECGSDGVARTRERDTDRLSRREVVDLTRYAVWSLRVLGYDVDYVAAVGKAEELKTENELGDDSIILEAAQHGIDEAERDAD